MNLKTDPSILVNGKTDNDMEEVSKYIQMEVFTKANGKIINVMEEVFSSGKMALFMRVIGKIMWLMVSAD